MNRVRDLKSAPTNVVRCAIYTRKSTEEGLDQDFNTLDAQRESGEAYIKSQQHEGWECLPEYYDDGGFTGANMERPALRRLMKDIETGKIDCILVYKVDRLSRSLLDFAKMMETFDSQKVSFVSVTQQFNTSTSMGRLVLNVLLSFAQFEREIISERTRDKIAAARRKGKWSGGMPILGYDVDPRGSKLVVSPDESVRVKNIFELYLEHQSLLATVKQLEDRGWLNKRWTTRKGLERGGKPFTKTSLHKLLTNVTYIGKLKYKDEIHEGEHDAIIEKDIWQQVQTTLSRNSRNGGAAVRNKFGALLKGILRCVPCDCAMSPTHTTRKGNKRYRYYVCSNAQKRGWHNCPSKSVPAGELEKFVVDQIRCIGRDPTLVHETLAAARKQSESQIAALDVELGIVERETVGWNNDVRKLVPLVGADHDESPATARLADLQERIGNSERRVIEVQDQIASLKRNIIDEREVVEAMASFDPVWDSLTLKEQTRIIQLLVERVDYDGGSGKVAITFHPSGIRTLTVELNKNESEDPT